MAYRLGQSDCVGNRPKNVVNETCAIASKRTVSGRCRNQARTPLPINMISNISAASIFGRYFCPTNILVECKPAGHIRELDEALQTWASTMVDRPGPLGAGQAAP
jgi:hypothetical protein